jgi:peptidoglycan/xylan/chitin deacetylase (PgdA/CDA1 family)
VPLGTGENYTEHVLRTLEANSVQDHIKAVFFVQTHVPFRGGSEVGRQLITRMGAAGHVVGIHTGSFQDHVDHRVRAARPPYDWNEDGVLDERDGANGLESDLLRAQARIEQLTGTRPGLVRPTYGFTNAAVRASYRTLGLQAMFWDVDSRDALDNGRGPAVIEVNVRQQVRALIRARHQPIIVLFHDINATTQAHLDDYLIAIFEAAEAEGKMAVFPTTTDELTMWLDAALGLKHEAKPYEIAPSPKQ